MHADRSLSPTVASLLDQGRLAESRGQRPEARLLYERALHALTRDTPTAVVAEVLLSVGRTYGDSDVGAALDCVEAVFALPRDPAMELVLAHALDLRGRLRWSSGDVSAAELDFHEMRERASRAGSPGVAALGDGQLGALAVLRGAIGDGIARYEAALEGYRADGDSDGVAGILTQLAPLYADAKRWNAAEQAFAEVMQHALARDDPALLGALELERAGMAIDRSNVERARASSDRALDFTRRAGRPALAARAIALSGVVAREQGDLARAERLLDQADRQAQDGGDLLLVAEVAREKADLFARQERHQVTLHALDRAYRALTQLRARPLDVAASRRVRRLDDGFLAVTRRWAQRIESKDLATAGHCERVAELAVEIARRMGVDGAAIFWYRVGAYLHDIGKLTIAPAILNKNGRLTPDEWALVKRHPTAGAEMLAEVGFPWEVRPIVESHHECWDGSGYPHGLAGEEIPLAARIFTVADVYDALVSRRSFKQALAHDEAVDVMRRDVGRQFDPAVFKVFEEAMHDGIAIPGVMSVAALADRSVESHDAPMLDDPLTSVAARDSWLGRAEKLLGERRGTGTPMALILLDIDRFTRLNATYGRLQGDDMLWAVAKVLQRGLRAADLIGRRGSDEFFLLLPDASPEMALEIAGRLCEAVARLRCARRDAPDESVAVSVSIAVASAPRDGESVETLLAAADRALFRAKRDGRNRVVVADHDDAAGARAQLDFDVFVARDDELREIVAQLDAASRGDARLVSISGEQGIGKSTLVRQLESEMKLRDGVMIHAPSLDGDDATPYAPWIDVIARLHALELLPDREWRALHQLVPHIGHSIDDADWAPAPELLEEEIVFAVRSAARHRLLFLVFEDVQWADTTSWAVVDRLLTAVDRDRLFVCLTLRSDEARRATEWRRRIAQHPRASQISLRRFSVAELRRWTQVVFHDADPGDDFPRFLHEYTEGIPLCVAYVLRALAEDGSIWYGGTRWEWRPLNALALPSGIGYVLERRLERLSSPARAVIAIAGVLGEHFAVEHLAAAASLSESQVRSAIDEAVAASVIVASGDARAGRYAFTHAMLAEASTRDVPERRRQRIHEVAARLLELTSPSAVAEIAAQYHAAGNDADAYRYALDAAERAASGHAHDDAIAYLQIAQRHAPTSRDLAFLRLSLAETAAGAGRYEYAEEQCDLALDWLDANAEPAASLRGRRLREGVRVRRGKSPRRALEALQALQGPPAPHPASAPRLDAGDQAATLLASSALACSLADWPAATAMARRGLDSLGTEAHPFLAAEGTLLLGVSRYHASVSEATTRLRDAVSRFAALDDRLGSARARHALGDTYLRSGRLVHADDALTQALEQARGAHSAPIAAAVSRSLGELRARQGALDEAGDWIGDAERLFSALHDEPERLRTGLTAAHLARQRADRSTAHALYDGASWRARELDVPWIELTALAGAALTNGGPEAETTRERWRRASELMAAAPPDWWFPGRELVDLLAVRLALVGGHAGVAFDLFARATTQLEATDPHAAVWLAGESGEELQRAGFPASYAARRISAERA
jgi:diguanylate cyclase (GGDEF)-like protein/putative nucleotidyltransferase with HDIG domain